MKIKQLQNLLQEKYGQTFIISVLNDGNQRNNVFIGNADNQEYIIKIEEDLKQTALSIEIAQLLSDAQTIRSSEYINNIQGEKVTLVDAQVITVQVKAPIKKLKPTSDNDFINIGKAVAEFHKQLTNLNAQTINKSDFYHDFMFGEVPLAQTAQRLTEINDFYQNHSPDYDKLTKGIAHNDLTTSNFLIVYTKYFVIDFEHLKYGPLISDIGVLVLDFWNYQDGLEDYLYKLELLLTGYNSVGTLNSYDMECIALFSLRYLISDENWYTFWAKHSQDDYRGLLNEIKEKQALLMRLLEKR